MINARFDNSCIHIVFVFFSCHVMFKVLYKFLLFFYPYNINIFVYSYCVHVIFRVISCFNYFFLYHIILSCLVLLCLIDGVWKWQSELQGYFSRFTNRTAPLHQQVTFNIVNYARQLMFYFLHPKQKADKICLHVHGVHQQLIKSQKNMFNSHSIRLAKCALRSLIKLWM